MLGTEKQLATEFVDTGQLQMVFWPVLNHGQPSVFSTLTAFCVGWQDPALFWEIHNNLFADQTALWRADRDYFVGAATAVGADKIAFEACYDDPASVAHIQELDVIRRERGISGQPVFDINGQVFFGAVPFDIFAGVIRTELPDE